MEVIQGKFHASGLRRRDLLQEIPDSSVSNLSGPCFTHWITLYVNSPL